jgi:hypothetical protein
MAIYAKEISPLPTPEIADSLAVDAGFPVAIYIAVALTAKEIRFGKTDGVAAGKFQLIPVLRMVTVQAPSFLFRVTQFYIGVLVLQFPLTSVYRKTRMAVTAGKYPRGKGGRGNRVFLMVRGGNRGAESDEHQQNQQ